MLPNMADLIVIIHKALHGGKVVEPHDSREFHLLVAWTPQQVDVAEPRDPHRLNSGITWALTIDSYASAFCGVVHPRQIRQITVGLSISFLFSPCEDRRLPYLGKIAVQQPARPRDPRPRAGAGEANYPVWLACDGNFEQFEP